MNVRTCIVVASMTVLAGSAWAHIPTPFHVRGTLTHSSLVEGPFAGASPGDEVLMSFLLLHPGVSLQANREERFTMIASTFLLSVGENAVRLPSPPSQHVMIENDLAGGDAILLAARALSYADYTLEWNVRHTHGHAFHMTDTHMISGVYFRSQFDRIDWSVRGPNGQSATFDFVDLTITPAPAASAALLMLAGLRRRRS